MNPTIIQTLISFVPGVIIAILTAIITVQLSLNQYRQERRWEKKYEAYSSILNALFRMVDYDCRYISSLEEGRVLNKDLSQKLSQLSLEGWDEFRRNLYIGNFVISDEATDCLRRLEKGFNNSDEKIDQDIYEAIDNRIFITKQCIDELRDCALRDLQFISRFSLISRKKKSLPKLR